MFKCTKCGLCCMSLKSGDLYKDLDRGDGTCKYFEVETKLCSIYNDRPLKCRVDDFFEIYLKDKISKEEYYRMNYEACKILQSIKN